MKIMCVTSPPQRLRAITPIPDAFTKLPAVRENWQFLRSASTKEKDEKLYYIGTNNPTDLTVPRRRVLTEFAEPPNTCTVICSTSRASTEKTRC